MSVGRGSRFSRSWNGFWTRSLRPWKFGPFGFLPNRESVPPVNRRGVQELRLGLERVGEFEKFLSASYVGNRIGERSFSNFFKNFYSYKDFFF